MDSLAIELNDIIYNNAPEVHSLMSSFAKAIFFPRGILTQTAEAKEKANQFDATIGIALDNGKPIYLPSVHRFLSGLDANDIYPYAPGAGKPELRRVWKRRINNDTPSLHNKVISNPISTCGITHGLSIAGDLFVDPGDVILLPDKFWGNYKLIFESRYNGKIKTYEFFNSSKGFNIESFSNAINSIAEKKNKIFTILNFPNNPTGYTPSVSEAKKIVDVLVSHAKRGIQFVVATDDSYLGFFYEDVLKESIFGYLAGVHKNILSIKLDGATKEEYAWGFRVGFITFAFGDQSIGESVYNALEKKILGAIRSKISNGPHLSQTLVLKSLESKTHYLEKKERYEIMKKRAFKVKEVLSNPDYDSVWSVYPFNSGYFMCLSLKTVNAEELRLHLLDKYGTGTISIGNKDLRIAFSAVDEKDIFKLYDNIYKGIKDLEQKHNL